MTETCTTKQRIVAVTIFLAVIFLVIFGVSYAKSKPPQADIWSGRYEFQLIDQAEDSVSKGTFLVAHSHFDADPEEARWTLTFEPNVGETEESQISQESFELQISRERFDQAGHAIECLVSNGKSIVGILICRVAPGTTVALRDGEKLLARTGWFGAILPVGFFELKKLDTPRSCSSIAHC